MLNSPENWDETTYAQTRGADSISDKKSKANNQTNNKAVESNKKPKPKLYTFYEYINKNKKTQANDSTKPDQLINTNKSIPNQNLKEPYSTQNFEEVEQNILPNLNILQKPQPFVEYQQSYSQPLYQTYIPSQVNPFQPYSYNINPAFDPRLQEMPISSGFGGYTTTTTRRRVQPVKVCVKQFIDKNNFL
jgi:hypothetical protein